MSPNNAAKRSRNSTADRNVPSELRLSRYARRWRGMCPRSDRTVRFRRDSARQCENQIACTLHHASCSRHPCCDQQIRSRRAQTIGGPRFYVVTDSASFILPLRQSPSSTPLHHDEPAQHPPQAAAMPRHYHHTQPLARDLDAHWANFCAATSTAGSGCAGDAGNDRRRGLH